MLKSEEGDLVIDVDGENIDKKLEILEEKINRVSKQVKEIKDMMVLFLDKQSQRKDFAGKDIAGKANVEQKKKEKIININEVDEDERPSYWDFEIYASGGDGKKNLWTLVQTQKGREIMNKIVKSDRDDEKIAIVKKKIKRFYPEAVKCLKKIKMEQNDHGV